MSEWRMRFGYETTPVRNAPCVFRLKSGGYLVTVSVRDRRRGGRRTAFEAMHGASLAAAKERAAVLRGGVRALARGTTRQQQRWSAFAASLFERKVTAGDLASAASIERWESTLRLHLIPAFGDYWCHQLELTDIQEWRAKVAARTKLPERLPHPEPAKARAGLDIKNPEFLSPRTANGWLSILKNICKQMTAELHLERDPAATVSEFSTEEHPTYTDDDPNALSPEQSAAFLAKMGELYPQHVAMTWLGFVTGLRPSSLRPLRKKGPDPDVLWDQRAIRVRRSNSRGQSIRNATKTGLRQRLEIPEAVMDALRAQPATYEDGEYPLRAESVYLFPARTGGMLSRSVLDKPFEVVSRAIGLPFVLTPKGLRRTNKDLMRAAQVPDVVAKKISGHTTDAMHERYSTAQSAEVRAAIEEASRLVSGDGAERSEKRSKGGGA